MHVSRHKQTKITKTACLLDQLTHQGTIRKCSPYGAHIQSSSSWCGTRCAQHLGQICWRLPHGTYRKSVAQSLQFDTMTCEPDLLCMPPRGRSTQHSSSWVHNTTLLQRGRRYCWALLCNQYRLKLLLDCIAHEFESISLVPTLLHVLHELWGLVWTGD